MGCRKLCIRRLLCEVDSWPANRNETDFNREMMRSKILLRRIVLLIINLGVLGCDFGRTFLPENPSLGTLTAKMNGNEWTHTYKNAYQTVQFSSIPPSTLVPCNTDRLDLFSSLYSTEGYLRQQLFFMRVPEILGKHSIIPFSGKCDENDPIYCVLYTIEQDGDVLAEIYTTLKGSDSYMQIDKFNKKTGEIKGAFQVTLVMEKRGDNPNLPDTLRFTNGRFHTKMITPARRHF